MPVREDFCWGFWAQTFYKLMMWMTVLVAWFYPSLLYKYIALLLFLGLGLKPLLVVTGVANLCMSLQAWLDARLGRKLSNADKKRLFIKERDKIYKMSPRRDSKLPKNW